MTTDIHNTTAADAASQDDPFILRASAFMRLATDQRTGQGPSAATLNNYVRDGLLPALRDSTGRLLFRASDAPRALQIYAARRERHGPVGRRREASRLRPEGPAAGKRISRETPFRVTTRR